MKEYNLTFSLKGTRDYVQGPDIFDNAMRLLSKDYANIGKVKYSAHNWIRNAADMVVDPKEDKSNYGSLIVFSSNNEKHEAYITDNGREIKDRIEYSEATVFNNSKIVGNEISLFNTQALSFSELIVSMNKYYLQNLGFDGKWIVTKFEYENYNWLKNYENKTIRIILLRNLKNRLTKSAVYLQEKKVGLIYFSLI